MADASKIEWTDATFNPWRGCTKVSAGCAHCYADTLSKRNPLTLGVWGPNGTRVVAAESAWREPVKWNRLAAEGRLPDGSPNVDGHRPRVFCASLADVFEDWQGGKDYPGEMVNAKGGRLSVNAAGHIWSYDTDGTVDDDWGVRAYVMDDVRRRLFDLIDATPNLDWLLVTKRPENMADMTPPKGRDVVPDDENGIPTADPLRRPNVWLGTSVENQAAADERIPHLLRAPAAVRFLSCEPLLGPVDLSRWLVQGWCPACNSECFILNGTCRGCAAKARPLIGWVIVGGESGPRRRPMVGEWAADLIEQCVGAGVATFVKQVEIGGRVCGDVSQFPSYLAVREFPAPVAVSAPATVEETCP